VSDYYTFKSLKALFVAFLDSYLHPDGVPGIKVGKVFALQFLCKLRHDG
jgi:hypothetical protein